MINFCTIGIKLNNLLNAYKNFETQIGPTDLELVNPTNDYAFKNRKEKPIKLNEDEESSD